MSDNLSDNERQLLAREVAADDYDRKWPVTTSYGEIPRESFLAGWDAAMEYVTAKGVDRLDQRLSYRPPVTD